MVGWSSAAGRPSAGTFGSRGEAVLDPVQLLCVSAQFRIGEAAHPGLLVAMDDRPELLENGEPRWRDLDDQAPAIDRVRGTADEAPLFERVEEAGHRGAGNDEPFTELRRRQR